MSNRKQHECVATGGWACVCSGTESSSCAPIASIEALLSRCLACLFGPKTAEVAKAWHANKTLRGPGASQPDSTSPRERPSWPGALQAYLPFNGTNSAGLCVFHAHMLTNLGIEPLIVGAALLSQVLATCSLLSTADVGDTRTVVGVTLGLRPSESRRRCCLEVAKAP